MFHNVGKTIKGIAVATFAVLCVSAFISGIVLMVSDEDLIGYGFLTWIAGPLVAFIDACFIYGFGEIVDTAIINRNGSCANIEHPQESKTVSAIVLPQQAVEEEPEPEKVDVVAQAAETGLCPKCGDKLYMNNSYCSKCGEFFAKSVL